MAYCLQPVNENAFIFCGATFSTNGDVIGNHGQKDGWIVKSGTDGSIIWQLCLGGSFDDHLYWAHQNADGSFLLCGNTYSTDGDITANKGDSDAWLISVSSTGEKLWQQTYGGSYGDFFTKAVPSSDGGTIVVGFTFSDDGDVSGLHGTPNMLADAWIVKLDNNGIIQWQRCFGGIDADAAYDVIAIDNNEYMVAATCLSRDGDVINTKGNRDIWLIHFNNEGEIISQKNYGGSFDDAVFSIKQTEDKGYIVAGYSFSDDGDLTGHFSDGISDFEDGWVFCTNSNGELLWQRNIGGTRSDIFENVIPVTNGYILTGHTNSNDGDIAGGTNGFKDYWILQVDNVGNRTGQQVIGGPFFDFAFSTSSLPDGSFLVAGFAGAKGGDIACTNGNTDVWVAELKPDALPIGCDDLAIENNGTNCTLNWSCFNNQSNVIYYIERSGNNNYFTSIGAVAGNTRAEMQQFFFTDPTPLPGNNLYRIKTKTPDAMDLYSNVVTCVSGIKQKIQIFPNPVQSSRNINLIFDRVYTSAVIEWHTTEGKKVLREMLPSGDKHLLKTPLNKGVYFLTIILGNASTHYNVMVL